LSYTSALIAVACVGLIAVGTITNVSFWRLLQVAAVLLFIGAVISGITITNRANPPAPIKVRIDTTPCQSAS
jgi:hypothetical protein